MGCVRWGDAQDKSRVGDCVPKDKRCEAELSRLVRTETDRLVRLHHRTKGIVSPRGALVLKVAGQEEARSQ
jgi:hypothetical protein